MHDIIIVGVKNPENKQKNNKFQEAKMKKTKITSMFLVVAILACSMLGLFGCGEVETENIDTSKTQITVKYYNGGNGQEWLDDLIAQFEATYANTSFEAGKKGVQIIKDFEKKNIMSTQIKTYGADVYMMEHVSYEDALSYDALYDLTELVNGNAVDLGGNDEGKTILSKMSEESKDYYGREVDGETKYYALPFFSAWHNMIYNIELFDKNGFYLNSLSDTKLEEFDTYYQDNIAQLEDYEYASQFFTDDKTDLSKGPDGEANTDDDGLPATYAEFKMLLEYIVQSTSVTPFIWNANAHHYLASWANDIWANYEGKDNMLMNLTLSSGDTLVDDLVKVINGIETQQEAVKITPANAYLLQQQRGKLEALKFIEMILSNGNYYEPDSFGNSLTHTDAQDYFINGDTANNKEYAILMDGTWWNAEAKAFFKNDTFSTAKFGIIPVPKVDMTHIGEAQTKIDGYISSIFIPSTIKDNKVKAATTFVKYINSDEAMCVFSKYTQSMRNMEYDIDDDTLAEMTEFGRQVYRSYKSDDFNVISWVPRSAEAQKNGALLNQLTYGWNSANYGSVNPGDVLYKNGSLTAADYFMDIVNNCNELWWATTYRK